MKIIYKLSLLCLIACLASCLGTKHLKENQLLLIKQNIKGSKTISTSELEDFYRQEPNLQFPLIPWAPYVSLYSLGENFYDKEKIRRKRDEQAEKYDRRIAEAEEKGNESRAQRLRKKKRNKIEKKNKVLEEGNLLMQVGEPVAVFDSTITAQTASQMKGYLHSKGFFHGEVGYKIETWKKNARVTYLIEENKPYVIDTTFLTVANNNIREIILSKEEESLINPSNRYDAGELVKERSRIDVLLKNHGYYEFSPQYIHFNVQLDSLEGPKEVSIETVIYQPSGRGYHKQFKIDSVIFTTDATTRGDLAKRRSKVVNGITYRFFEENYSKKVLDKRVFLRPDSLYSRQMTLETQKQLANLDIFKFINITYDTTGGRFNALLYTSPLKKYQTSTELGATYSQGFPLPQFGATLRNRNPFGGLEILQLNLQAGGERVPGTINPDTTFTSIQLGANLSLTFPQFIAPLGPGISRRLGRLNPKTRFLAGLSYLERAEFKRTNVNASLTYNWQTEKARKGNVYTTFFSIAPVSLSVIDSEFKLGNADGRAYLDSLHTWAERGYPLIRSFDDSFVSSMYAVAVFNKNNFGTFLKKSRYVRSFFESGGTTQNLLSFPYTTEDSVRESGALRAFRFLKFSNDYRKYIPLRGKTALAYRINVGVAIPYGSENATLPYEKFFFAGGSNSIRSYRPRRLGPGVYNPPKPGKKDDPQAWGEEEIIYNAVEQPGEVLLEGSVEFRHNIFGFLNGAVFLDFGNTWRLEESEATPGGEFRINEFYKQIALGGGYGVRFDFSFLILRLDLGVKLFNPMAVTRNENGSYNYSEGWTFDKFQGFPFKRDLVILNIGIGYPF